MEKIIGQLIQERIKAIKMDVTVFADLINRERSAVYYMFKKDNIDTVLLKKIGQILEYDFFQDLLEPETIQKIVLRESLKKSKILVEVEINEEDIKNLELEERIINILKR